ncbi:MAG: glycoside hydrolase family 55 protein, partial [Lentisphaeria bacterium]|nr:glycoside hydrolase family 55 protein [Lentisphaeria bacterium]
MFKLIAAPVNALNVKDFGAVGDGVADDTAAIQKAIAASTERKANILLARQPMVDDLPELAHLKALSTTTENTIQPEVFLPKGVYRVSKTLVAGSLVLRGENDAVIRMDNPSQDVLYSHWGYRVRVSNVTFDGGRRQLLLYTGNNDMANFCVEDCVFRNSSAAAIWSHNYRRPSGHDFSTMTMGPYTVENTPDGPKLTPNDESQPYFAHSTLA